MIVSPFADPLFPAGERHHTLPARPVGRPGGRAGQRAVGLMEMLVYFTTSFIDKSTVDV